jgi:hypothetical protein
MKTSDEVLQELIRLKSENPDGIHLKWKARHGMANFVK